MSTSVRRREFQCFNDCRSEGCPGHVLTIKYHNTSDTISVLVDDEVRLVCDDGFFSAMYDAHSDYLEDV